MKPCPRFFFTAVGAAVVSATTALAQLSGTIYGDFNPLSPADRGYDYTTVSNTGSDSSLWTGDPADADGQTQVRLMDTTFSNVGSGGILAQDFIQFHNGYNLEGTTADHASVDLRLDLPDHGVTGHYLTTLNFTVDNTPNAAGDGTPDGFFLTFTPPPSPLDVAGMRLWFALSFAGFDVEPGTEIPERGDGATGLLTVTFVPIPEPATYALAGMAILSLAIAVRRARLTRPGESA